MTVFLTMLSDMVVEKYEYVWVVFCDAVGLLFLNNYYIIVWLLKNLQCIHLLYLGIAKVPNVISDQRQ